MKFLIIEDEVLIQKSLKRLLERKGCEVSATGSGTEGIELIKQNEYDKIICDLMLNDITGFDILESIKTKYTIEDISNKFIIITAYSSESVLEKAKSYNCRVISKPFDNISDVIETFLGNK